jgi:hypothetical protein
MKSFVDINVIFILIFMQKMKKFSKLCFVIKTSVCACVCWGGGGKYAILPHTWVGILVSNMLDSDQLVKKSANCDDSELSGTGKRSNINFNDHEDDALLLAFGNDSAFATDTDCVEEHGQVRQKERNF